MPWSEKKKLGAAKKRQKIREKNEEQARGKQKKTEKVPQTAPAQNLEIRKALVDDTSGARKGFISRVNGALQTARIEGDLRAPVPGDVSEGDPRQLLAKQLEKGCS